MNCTSSLACEHGSSSVEVTSRPVPIRPAPALVPCSDSTDGIDCDTKASTGAWSGEALLSDVFWEAGFFAKSVEVSCLEPRTHPHLLLANVELLTRT